MPSTRSVAKFRNSCGRPSSPTTGRPPVTRNVAPLNMTMVPSVAIKGFTSSFVTISPFSSPTAAPIATPATMPGTIPYSSITIAEIQPDSAATDPTDRSKPPQTMTYVMPMAMTVITAPCISTLFRLMGDRNRLETREAITHRTIRAINGIWFQRVSFNRARLVSVFIRLFSPPERREARAPYNRRRASVARRYCRSALR